MKKSKIVLAAFIIMAGTLAACSSRTGAGVAGNGVTANGGNGSGGTGGTAAAGADSAYPAKTIELIVPFGPGGGADVAARLLSSYLEQELGQTIVINNVTGGGGSIGLTQLADAKPDGYTLSYFSSTDSNGDLLFEGVGYNKDSFAPICQFAADPHILVTSKKSGITNIQGVIEAGSDGKTLWGIGGAWTHWDFLKMEFEKATNTDYKRLVFDGGATAVNNVANGDCAIATPFISEALAQIDTGNLIPIAVTGTKRSPMVPDVPTLSESGVSSLSGFQSVMWRGLVAPAGTPDQVTAAISEAVGKVCQNSEFLEKAGEAGITVDFMGMDEFKGYYGKNHEEVKSMIQNADFNR